MVRVLGPEPEQSRGIPGESLTRKITTNTSLLVGEKLTESLIQLDLIVVWRLLRNFYIIHCIVGTEGGARSYRVNLDESSALFDEF